MLDLMHRNYDAKKFIFDLEQWIIDTLMEFGVEGKRRQSRIGIWVEKTAKGTQLIEEAKIAAIGVRIRRWVSYHGISLNIKPDLKHFSGIIPCGVDNYGVTSLDNLGIATSSKEVAEKLSKVKPASVGQASRISGVTPAASNSFSVSWLCVVVAGWMAKLLASPILAT